MEMVLFVFTILLSSVYVQAYAEGLSGLAVNCGGNIYGFKAQNQLSCLSISNFAGLTSIPCGSYSYDSSTGDLSGEIQGSSWSASNVIWEGKILVSFQALSTICNTIALNWEVYNPNDSIFFECPLQNAIQDVSYLENTYTLHTTGFAELRSKFETLAGNGNTVVSDSFGVYEWFSDGSIRIYFGPQQGRNEVVQSGTMNANSGLYIDIYTPSGPCTPKLTSISKLQDINQLPKSNNQLPKSNNPKPTSGGCKLVISTSLFFFSLLFIKGS